MTQQKFVHIVFAFLAGCATIPALNTPSGQPEIMLHRIKPDCVRAIFKRAIVEGGYSIRSSTDSQIVAGTVVRNSVAAFLMGSSYSTPLEDRMTVMFEAQFMIDSLRVIVSHAVIKNPGTEFEKVVQIKGRKNELDELLESKPLIERQCPSKLGR